MAGPGGKLGKTRRKRTSNRGTIEDLKLKAFSLLVSPDFCFFDKFEDGQFEDCDITIKQLNTIQESLIKSLNAMYHARIKYPEAQAAVAT